MTGRHGKAEFASLREMTGVSQSMIADQLGVQPKTVKCWESPAYKPQPSPAAWQLVESMIAEQTKFALRVKSMAEKGSITLRVVRITRRDSKAEIINARIRAALQLLTVSGLPFTVSYAPMPSGTKINMSRYVVQGRE